MSENTFEKLYEIANDLTKKYNREMQRFRKRVEATPECKILVLEKKRLKRELKRVEQEIKLFKKEGLTKELGELREKQRKAWEELQKFNKNETVKA